MTPPPLAGLLLSFSTLAFAGSVLSARPELLVLQTGASGETHGAVRRYEPDAGAQTAVFGQPNEGFLSLAVGPQQELFVAANILGTHSLLRFNRAGQFLGAVASGWQAGFCRRRARTRWQCLCGDP